MNKKIVYLVLISTFALTGAAYGMLFQEPKNLAPELVPAPTPHHDHVVVGPLSEKEREVRKAWKHMFPQEHLGDEGLVPDYPGTIAKAPQK